MRKTRQDLFFAPVKRRKFPTLLAFLFVFLLLLTIILVANIANNRVVETIDIFVPVLNLEKDLENLTILHLSDLHGSFLGPEHKFFSSAIAKKRFDIVCITGGILGPNEDMSAIKSMLEIIRHLNKEAPILFVPGDEDPNPITNSPKSSSEVLAPYLKKLDSLGVIYLDAPIYLEFGKSGLWFSPKEQYAVNIDVLKPTYERQLALATSDTEKILLNYYLDQVNRIELAQKQMKDSDYHIILSHFPLTQKEINNLTDFAPSIYKNIPFKGVILSLCGHYNGGQWRSPFLEKIIYIPEVGFFLEDEGYVGTQFISGILQHISPGMGSSSFYPMKGRLFNRPAISFLKLTGQLR